MLVPTHCLQLFHLIRLLFSPLFLFSHAHVRQCYILPDDESGEKSVSVLLNGEESELTFIDHSTAEMSVS